MTLLFHPSGPLVRYTAGMFKVHDLNPEVSTAWRMSRAEMAWLGLRCLAASVFAR